MEKHWSTIRDSFFIYLKYREGLPLVLKDLSFAIEAGQRVGIVGRTGAGKSSVTLTLFLIIELDQGKYFFEIENFDRKWIKSRKTSVQKMQAHATSYSATN